jgi:hypothetical protein
MNKQEVLIAMAQQYRGRQDNWCAKICECDQCKNQYGAGGNWEWEEENRCPLCVMKEIQQIEFDEGVDDECSYTSENEEKHPIPTKIQRCIP